MIFHPTWITIMNTLWKFNFFLWLIKTTSVNLHQAGIYETPDPYFKLRHEVINRMPIAQLDHNVMPRPHKKLKYLPGPSRREESTTKPSNQACFLQPNRRNVVQEHIFIKKWTSRKEMMSYTFLVAISNIKNHCWP